MKKLSFIFLFLIAICSIQSVNAQATLEWQKCLGGSNDDYGYSLQQTTDGGFIVAGSTRSNDGDVTGNHGNYDYWIVKLDATGSIVWQKCLGGTADDEAKSIQQTTDGGFIVSGNTVSDDGDVSGNNGGMDYWVVKLDLDGNIVWQKCLGGTYNDYATSAQQTSDGGFIVAGYSNSTDVDVTVNHGLNDYWIVKLDTDGNLVWQKSFGGNYDDLAYSVEPTSDGGYIVAGKSSSNDGDVSGNNGYYMGVMYDYWLVRLDSGGNLIWQKCLGGPADDMAYSVKQTSDGGFIVAGFTESGSADVLGNNGYEDYWVVKTDPNGSLVWQKCLGGDTHDKGYSIQQTFNGNYIVAGFAWSANGDVTLNKGGHDRWIVELDSIGNIFWQKSIGGNADDDAYSVQQTADSGFIAAGFTCSINGDVSGNHGGCDFWITKFSPGQAQAIPEEPPAIEWQKSLGGSAADYGLSAHQTSDGGFIMSGYSSSSDFDVSSNQGAEDYWIVRLGINGDTIWKKSLGGSESDEASAALETSDGGFIIGGSSESNDGDVSGNHGGRDIWLVKLDIDGNTDWQKSFGGSAYDDFTSIQQTTDGGYIVAGFSASNDGDVSGNHGYEDEWIVKLDNLGTIQWQKSLGGTSRDYGCYIQQTTDGGYVVAGISWSNDGDVSGNHGVYDYWVTRLDAVGNLVWQKSLGGSNVDLGYAVQQTTDGGFIVAGVTASYGGDITGNHGGYDIWIVKLDADGNLTWQNALGGTNGDQAYNIIQSSDGNYVVAGLSESNNGDVTGNHPGFYGNPSVDYWIIKLDTSGKLMWQESLGGSGSDYAYSLEQTTDGGLIVAGYSWSNDGDATGNHGYEDEWIVKLSCNQPQPFYADADGDGFGNANDTLLACTMPSGYAANYSDCNDSNSNINPNTSEISNNGIDDNCDGFVDECFAYFTLVADSLVPHHYWLVSQVGGVPPISYVWYWGDGSTDTGANPSHTYAAAGFYSICLSIHDSTGCTDSVCVNYELLRPEGQNTIISVDVVDSIPSIPTTVQNTNVLQSWSVFPNPASGNVFVNYSLLSPETVSIEVYDVLGSKLRQTVNSQEAGAHHSTINLEKLPDGVYFLQIRAGDQIASQKLIVAN